MNGIDISAALAGNSAWVPSMIAGILLVLVGGAGIIISLKKDWFYLEKPGLSALSIFAPLAILVTGIFILGVSLTIARSHGIQSANQQISEAYGIVDYGVVDVRKDKDMTPIFPDDDGLLVLNNVIIEVEGSTPKVLPTVVVSRNGNIVSLFADMEQDAHVVEDLPPLPLKSDPAL